MRRTPALLAAVLALGVLTGCGGTQSNRTEPPAAKSSAAYPVTVGTVTLDKQPTRIVSLSPTATEMLFAVGAGKQVTAVDDQSNYPADAPKSDLSGFKPNAEAIAAKNPDLVVISNDTDKITNQLTALKIPVYLAPAAKTLDDTYRELTEIGELTGHRAESAHVVTRMKDDIAKIVKDLPQRSKHLTYYWELDPTLYSVTSKTFVGSLLAMLGMDSVADPADADGTAGGYPQLSAESLVKANPDVILLADTKCCHQSAATVRARPGWAGITAVQKGQVYGLDDDIASRWGPRVVDLLRAVADDVSTVSA
ncbi:MAG TPA: ABC transporter substrate-binding protein [Micromonosporaceae bacterium]